MTRPESVEVRAERAYHDSRPVASKFWHEESPEVRDRYVAFAAAFATSSIVSVGEAEADALALAADYAKANDWNGAYQAMRCAYDLRATPSPLEGEREGIYVASRASVPERSAMWRRFRGAGVPIVSTWIDEAGEGETACNRELWLRIEREVTGAARLVLYVEPDDFPLKGALIEVGMALSAGIPVTVVAPGVECHPHTMRPLGSWAKHPLVSFCDWLPTALQNQPHD